MNQSYTPSELLKLSKDIELDFLNLQEEEFRKELKLINDSIINQEFSFDFKLQKGNFFVDKNNFAQKLILRKLNDNIKRIYKDEQSNRRMIISQIKTLLDEKCPFWILKTDIKSFYESIKVERILQRLKEDAMLSFHSLFLLKKIFEYPLVDSIGGLPRGVSVSSTLSEYYMRKFDKWARQFEGVYYYARFVDDIIIFTNTKQSAQDIENSLDFKLKKLAPGLQKNPKKTKIYDGRKLREDDPLTYLGYKFYRDYEYVLSEKHVREEKIIKNLNYIKSGEEEVISCTEEISFLSYRSDEGKVKKDNLIISIADSKIKKIKSRLVSSFLDFIRSDDFDLLEKRIKFLTGNYPIRKNNESKQELRAGIYYNYLQITSFESLIDLDHFYRALIYSRKQSLGGKISSKLTEGKKNVLKKYSFLSGYENKVYHSFKPEEMNKIVSCW